VAPPSFEGPLTEALGAAGLQVLFHPRPEPEEGVDPFHLEALARRLVGQVEGLLLVVPEHRAPNTVVPGPVVGGLPVGLVFAREPRALDSWVAAVAARGQQSEGARAVLAAWEDHYLGLGRRFARQLRAARGRQVTTWFADRLNRLALLERLTAGPVLATYFGHGHMEGLGGYHGVYREHFEASPSWQPCGLFAAWACDTLKHPRHGVPFGRFLVESGRAAAFLGSTRAVKTPDNAALVALAGERFEEVRPSTLGQWACAIEAALEPGSPAQRAWRTYRILGNPRQPV
jgi:hypothetical protein